VENHRAEASVKGRTKIVATVGPASRSPEVLGGMIEAGADVFRLNFSHGTHADHDAARVAIRRAADAAGRIVGILQDLGGPKIRLGPIPGDAVECRLGEAFTLVADRSGDDPRQLTCTYRELAHDLKAGDPVLFADGAVAMRVLDAEGGRARLDVTLPGRLKSQQGLNLPGAALRVEALTAKDLRDLDWSARNAVDYVGLSFVRRAADVARLRRELEARGLAARIVAKIEKPEALEDLGAILAEADAEMVARGDLGVEMDVARVPAAQKQIIAACAGARMPVITATQMLNSMETSSRPTRAEASDVFNAVLDGTDAVMLSGETAIGLYPVEAVATMSRIVAVAAAFDPGTFPSAVARRANELLTAQARTVRVLPITEGVVEAASLVCRRLNAALLIVITHSGRTALALSKRRHPTPTLALCPAPEVARALSLYWGVTPIHVPDIEADGEHALAFAQDWARARHLVAPGDRIVLVRGTLPGNPVHNAILVQEVGG